jgi:hypothetical protein
VAFDSLACFVWIDLYEAAGPRDVGARGAGALCTRHADRLVPPRGWAVQDRRSAAPPLWSDRPVVERPVAPAPLPRRVDAASEPSPPVVMIDAPLPFDATPGTVPVEREGARDDIEVLLARPTSRLLSRAFDHARGGHLD